MTGQRAIDCGRVSVVHAVVHRADHGGPVHLAGQLGHQGADTVAGERRGNCPEFTPDSLGGVWLGVPHVQVGRATVEVDQDARVGPCVFTPGLGCLNFDLLIDSNYLTLAKDSNDDFLEVK